MLFREALLAGLALIICYGGNWLLGQCHYDGLSAFGRQRYQ